MTTSDQYAVTDKAGRKYVLLSSMDDVLTIRAEWDRLWGDAQAAYFLSFSCIYASWNAIHRPQGAALCCVVAFANGRLLAALPMVRRRRKSWKAATTCGPRAAEGFDILIERSAESHAIASVLLQKFLILARPDFIEFEFVKSGSHLDVAIQSIPDLRIVETVRDQIPYADLKAEVDWLSYGRSLSKRYQSQVARKSRRLHEQGKVAVEVVRGMPTPVLDWLFQEKQKWSERTHKRGDWVFSARYKEFVGKLLASDPRYVIFVLKLDDAPIAVKFLAINSSSASLILLTYDDKYKHFSPGNILDESMMSYIFENYRDRDGRHLDVDFGPGLEHYKLHWCRGNLHPAISYQIATSRWGLARYQLKHLVAWIRRLGSAAAI